MAWWKDLSGRQKVALTVGVVAVLALLVVLLTQIFPRGAEPQARQTPAPGGFRTLKLGEVATISPDYRVSVTKVTVYRRSGSPFVAATVKAKYTGTGEGEPWSDLSIEFAGSGDSRSFPSSTCPIDLDEAVDTPALGAGDIGTFAACSTLSANEVKGGTVSVIDSALKSDQRYYWSSSETVTKTLPSINPLENLPTRGPVAGQAIPGGFSAADATKAATKAACEDFDDDDYKKYKASGEKFKNYVESNRQYYDSDDLDDYDDWKKKFDKQIEYLDKAHDLCT